MSTFKGDIVHLIKVQVAVTNYLNGDENRLKI